MAREQHDYDDIPGTFVFDAESLAPGLRHQHVLHVADEGGQPQGLQGERGGVPEEGSAHATADRGDPQARLQPHAGARRQHLFHRQARRDRRPLVPPSRRRHDRVHAGGLRRHDARRRPLGRRQSQQVRQGQSRRGGQGGKSKPKSKRAANRGRSVARIIAGVASSHVPAIGAAIDNKQTEEPYWKRVFSGFERSKEWMAKTKPDVAIVVYNDHASAFSVEIVPTFALGCAAEFPPADEGWGPRPVRWCRAIPSSPPISPSRSFSTSSTSPSSTRWRSITASPCR